MFKSFFPNPRLFFPSFLLWSAICMVVWYLGANMLGGIVGLPPEEGAGQLATVEFFFSNNFIWFYIYFAASIALFAAFWFTISPHKWQNWSIVVAGFLLFSTAFSVQTSVALNNWRRPFFDMVQQALTGDTKGTVEASAIYSGLLDFVMIAFIFIAVAVVTRFVTSHFIFRWRTAMNDYYAQNWKKLRHVEGASQRVQEDTMRFAETVEVLGINAIDSVLTLIAFIPILYGLGSSITALPIIGQVPAPLVVAAIGWALFGTTMLALFGIKLPGLYFKNQRVEAAYRKELVYGEDDVERAQPQTLSELFANVRTNYFRLYFHYAYFNVARFFYGQADNVFGIFILIPTIAAGAITFGFFQQVLSAFGQVSNSFQYLVNAWGTIVELLSIHKRLKAFEAVLDGEALPDIDQEYLADVAAQIDVGPEEIKSVQ